MFGLCVFIIYGKKRKIFDCKGMWFDDDDDVKNKWKIVVVVVVIVGV